MILCEFIFVFSLRLGISVIRDAKLVEQFLEMKYQELQTKRDHEDVQRTNSRILKRNNLNQSSNLSQKRLSKQSRRDETDRAESEAEFLEVEMEKELHGNPAPEYTTQAAIGLPNDASFVPHEARNILAASAMAIAPSTEQNAPAAVIEYSLYLACNGPTVCDSMPNDTEAKRIYCRSDAFVVKSGICRTETVESTVDDLFIDDTSDSHGGSQLSQSSSASMKTTKNKNSRLSEFSRQTGGKSFVSASNKLDPSINISIAKKETTKEGWETVWRHAVSRYVKTPRSRYKQTVSVFYYIPLLGVIITEDLMGKVIWLYIINIRTTMGMGM